jgi:hypothetical protein
MSATIEDEPVKNAELVPDFEYVFIVGKLVVLNRDTRDIPISVLA